MTHDDHHLLRDLRLRHHRGPTLAPSAKAMASLNAEASRLRLVTDPAPLDAGPWAAPPPRRAYPSVPRSGPVRIAARARRDRLWTAGIAAAAASFLALLVTLVVVS
jgi:hypothetical protein